MGPRGDHRIGWRLIAAAVLAVLFVAVLVASLLVGSGGTDHAVQPGAGSTAGPQPPQSRVQSPASKQSAPPGMWTAPNTTDPERMAEAFAAAIWTYDSRSHSLDDWRFAVSVFADPNGPSASGEVARSMLPLWMQWEQLSQQNAHADVASISLSTPRELQALADDPRVPPGWHGYVVEATQRVTADGETFTHRRRASVAVVCRPRCWLWSATYEGPQ